MKLTLLSIILSLISFAGSEAQNQNDISVIKLSKWTGFEVLDPFVLLYVDSAGKTSQHISEFDFKKPPHNYLNEPVSWLAASYLHYYKVRVENDTPDTVQYFFLASPQKDFFCYRNVAGKYELLSLERHSQHGVAAAQVAKFNMHPGEVAEFVIQLKFPLYAEAYVYLWMPPVDKIKMFFTYQQALSVGNMSFQWVICGMLAMMFLYIILKYVQIRSIDYLYYSLYILFFLIYFSLKLASGLGVQSIAYSDLYGGLFNNQVQVYAYIMYFLFFQSFLNTHNTIPTLHTLSNYTIVALLVYLSVDTILYFLPHYFELKETLWNILRIIMVVITFTAIALIIRAKSPLGMYLIVGGFILAFLGILAMIFSLNFQLIGFLPFPLNTPITYFQVGVVAELICFTLGLGYKNRMDEQEKVRAQAQLQSVTERQEFERYRAMMDAREEERNRIAKDLHDGVGGLLSGVKMSLTQMQNRLELKEDDTLLFARSLDMLDGSMQEIRRVSHAMMPPSLQQFGLTVALRDFAEAINSMKTIEVVFQVVGNAPEQFLLDKQLMIYRIVQELVNNVLKHAHASKCLIQLVYSDLISITVEDDGVGFNKSETKGAGLSNIRQRVEFLRGTIDWVSIKGEGTSVMVEIPMK